MLTFPAKEMENMKKFTKKEMDACWNAYKENPIYELYECERGARWSTPINRPGAESYDGKYCSFSGCLKENHRVYRVKTCNEDPLGWFKCPYEKWEESDFYLSILKTEMRTE